MAKRPRKNRERAASGLPPGGDIASAEVSADRGRNPWAEADEAVLRLARLIGRQMARDQFEGEDRKQQRPKAKDGNS